jgi:hypothetical protein
MNKAQSPVTAQARHLKQSVERRASARTHAEQWPEAMREEFRKVQFLDAVEVGEVDPGDWRAVFASFEGRHIRFL